MYLIASKYVGALLSYEPAKQHTRLLLLKHHHPRLIFLALFKFGSDNLNNHNKFRKFSSLPIFKIIMLNHKFSIRDGQMHQQEPCINQPGKQRRKSEIIQPHNKPKCIQCGFTGQMVIEERHGCASISWIACLTVFTGIFFWIPLLKGCCRDKVTLCPECCHEISIEYADCF